MGFVGDSELSAHICSFLPPWGGGQKGWLVTAEYNQCSVPCLLHDPLLLIGVVCVSRMEGGWA